MRIAQILTIRDKIDFNLRVKTEVDVPLVNKIKEGKAVDSWFEILSRESEELKAAYFRDEKGLLKRSMVTGQILDWTM